MMKQDIAFKDIEPGDLVTLSYEGHEFTGEAWRHNYGMLMVGATAIDIYDGSLRECVFVSATREVKLPTGIGAVVRDGDGDVYVRTGDNSWEIMGFRTIATADKEVESHGEFEVLSEGVEID